MKTTARRLQSKSTDDKTARFVVGATPPPLSEAAKKKLARQRPSKKAIRLVASISKAKVAINY